jgi:hypothetical protein
MRKELTPEQENNALLRQLRGEGDENRDAGQVAESANTRTVGDRHPPLTSSIPDVVNAVLLSDRRGELVEVAKMLYEAQVRVMTVHTAVGDIKCRVTWRSEHPRKVEDGLFIVKTLSTDTVFAPRPGSLFDISFDDCDRVLSVCCVSSPCRIYPGIDLLCFIPQPQSNMEKNGKLKDGAPSVVSGLPSDAVDPAGEPLRDGEKSAAATSVKSDLAPAGEFDRIRP